MSSPEFQLPESASSASPQVGLILGSGLGGFVDALESAVTIDYDDIDGVSASTVPGHAGKLHLGTLNGVEIAVAQGRLHCYEGHTATAAAAPVRLFQQLGVSTLVLTNAAGVVNANFKPGRWMLLSDHLNMARLSPLNGAANFIDQTAVYSRDLRDLLKAIAFDSEETKLYEGIYAWVNGPEYETPAEIRMLRTLGADAVGMSTVPEAIQARALGMRVTALSCLTNFGAGLSGQPLSHEEVIEVGQQAAFQLFSLLESAIPAMVEI